MFVCTFTCISSQPMASLYAFMFVCLFVCLRASSLACLPCFTCLLALFGLLPLPCLLACLLLCALACLPAWPCFTCRVRDEWPAAVRVLAPGRRAVHHVPSPAGAAVVLREGGAQHPSQSENHTERKVRISSGPKGEV